MQPPVNGRISSPFGPRSSGYHAGIDYKVDEGTPVSASGSGTIVRASYNATFGNVIVIDHGAIGLNGEHIYTLYAHLIEMNVNLGDTVSAGQVIGGSGGRPNTNYSGRSDAPHLHFEVLQSPNGAPLQWRTTGPMGHNGTEFRVEPKKYFDEALTVVPTRIDPLILDLDGDGIETLHVKDGAYFDHDGNGFAEQTGWAAPDDGLLVMDRNADGVINGGKELFGDQTILRNNTRAGDSFQAVADLDDNLDGRIDINDAAFSQLRVWKDEDGDGHSTAGELYSLEQLGITAINTGYTSTNVTDTNGNIQVQAGLFEKTGGTTGQMGSFQVQRDTTYTIANELMAVPADIETLPDLQGTGNIYDLHQTMVRDTSGQLRTLVEQFNASTDVTMRNSLMEEILFKWTGADSIDPNSRGANIDARRLDVLEKFFGMGFMGVNGSDPNTSAAALLDQSYEGMFEMLYGQLMAQTHLTDFYGMINYSWDGTSPSAKGSVTNVITQINTMLASDYSSGIQALTEFTRTLAGQKGWEVMTDFQEFRVQFAKYGDDIEWYLDSTGKNILAGTGANDSISGTINADAIKGKGGNDIIFGNAGDDTLYGGDGGDSLCGEDGADIMNGGAGNDNMEGSIGNDTYIFNPGSGQDTIVDNDTSGSIDRIEFGAGISSSDIELVKGTNLTINIKGTTDSLKIGNWFSSTNPNDYRIEEFKFSDGLVLSIADLEVIGGYKIYGSNLYGDTLYGTYVKDEIYGYDGGDFLYGYGGDDSIYGGNGFDWIYGGDGNDLLDAGDETGILYGENGDDILNGGSGNDTLYGGDGNDVLSGGADFDYLYGETGDDTYVIDDTLYSMTESVDGGIDTVKSSISFTLGANIENLTLTGTDTINATGNTLNNIITGNSSSNTIDGGAGADIMSGGAGDDRYLVETTGDTVIEVTGEGTDIVESSISYTLGANVENLLLTGNSAINGTGNSLNNLITGNSVANILNGGVGYDTLNGGEGTDTMVGGKGNDTFIVDNAGDVVTEALNEGTDKVQSFISYTLGENIENLSLTGSSAVDGTGNSLNNTITGNTMANVLRGEGGNDTINGWAGRDTLDGGVGNDSLNGGRGNDTYIFNQGYGQDAIDDYSSDSATTTDVVQINTIPLDLIFTHAGNNLDVSIYGTTDQITIQNWYSGAAYQTEEFKTSDSGKLINTQIDQLIQTMATFSADTGLSWSEAIQQRPQDVQTILAQYWESGGQP